MKSSYEIAKEFAVKHGFESVKKQEIPWENKDVYSPIYDIEQHEKGTMYFASCNDYIIADEKTAEWLDGDDYDFYLIQLGLD